MANDFRIMRWNASFDGAWGPEAEERYRLGGFDGISFVPAAGLVLERLDFLASLPNLRYLDVSTKVADDRAAFEIESLEDLTLITGCKREVPSVVNSNLRRLCLTDRKGIRIAERWPRLQYLRIGQWRSNNLELIEGADHLVSVNLEGRRQPGSLSGVEGCIRIRELVISNYAVEGTSPLRFLGDLRELRLLAMKPTPSHRRVDISDIHSRNLARIWIGHGERLDSLDLLLRFEYLREARFIDCDVPDAVRTRLMASPVARKITFK